MELRSLTSRAKSNGLHTNQGVGIQHWRSNERHRSYDAVKDKPLQLIEQATGGYLDGWVNPNDCVDNITEVAAEVRQATPQMIADERELIFERFAKHRLAVAQADDAGDGREDEIAGPHPECRAECATERVVALNVVAVEGSHQRICPTGCSLDEAPNRRSGRRRSTQLFADVTDHCSYLCCVDLEKRVARSRSVKLIIGTVRT